jgi:hypothetical protein
VINELKREKMRTYSESFTLLLPLEQAFIVSLNHMNFVPSHKLQEAKTDDPTTRTFEVKLRLPWHIMSEIIRFELQNITESETHVTVTSKKQSLPLSSSDLGATKKVLSYLRQHQAFKSNKDTLSAA